MSIETLQPYRLPSYFYELAATRNNKFQQLSYKQCEHLWSYGGKTVLLFRNFLNVIARSSFTAVLAGTSYPCKIQKVVTHLKLFSIVGVPFSLVDLKSSLNTFFGKTQLLTTDVLSFVLLIADTVDSTSTFINSSLTLNGMPTIEALSSMGLPLGFMMAGIGTISRTIQIARSCHLYKKMNVKSYQEEINEEKKALLQRIIPKDALIALENLLKREEVSQSLETIQGHLEKKIHIDLIGILANVTILFALSLFSVGITNAYPFSLMTIAFMIRLASVFYQDQKLLLQPKGIS